MKKKNTMFEYLRISSVQVFTRSLFLASNYSKKKKTIVHSINLSLIKSVNNPQCEERRCADRNHRETRWHASNSRVSRLEALRPIHRDAQGVVRDPIVSIDNGCHATPYSPISQLIVAKLFDHRLLARINWSVFSEKLGRERCQSMMHSDWSSRLTLSLIYPLMWDSFWKFSLSFFFFFGNKW